MRFVWISLAASIALVSHANAQTTMQPIPDPPATPAAQPARPAPAAKPNPELIAFRTQPQHAMPVYITRTTWTEQDETAYSEFVAQIGRGIKARPGRTIRAYMKDPAVNSYASTDPAGLVLYTDCADLPYFLRAYFAYKNGLPFSSARSPSVNFKPFSSPADQDAKLVPPLKTTASPYGNTHAGRGVTNAAAAPGQEKNFVAYWANMLDTISTGTFRVGPLSPNYEWGDVYPVRIDKNGVRPGTIVHTTGHIYVVVAIDKRGGIEMIDAHPDNSVTYKIFDSDKLDRSRPDHGYGFFRFRPMHAVGGLRYDNGAIYGAKVVPATDDELYAQGMWSLEQWYGPFSPLPPRAIVTPTQYQGSFGRQNFFDVVRARLKDPNHIVTADELVGDSMVSLCEDFKQRVGEVQKAITAGLPSQPHIPELPANIYDAHEPWESLSTPSRDARLRQAVANLPGRILSLFAQAKADPRAVSFNGTATDYQATIRSRFALMDATCKVAYKNSLGKSVSIKFSDLIRRTPLLSFDPYHCAERRWGATGAEAASCRDQDYEGEWYLAQQSMRNTVGKQDENEVLFIRSNTPITLEMLQSQAYLDQSPRALVNLGTARAKTIDVATYVNSKQFLLDLQNPKSAR